MTKLLKKTETYILYGLVFFLPLFFLPISTNIFVPAKLSLLVFGLSLVIISKSIRAISEGKLSWSIGKFDFPAFLLASAYIASTILRTPNKIDALFLPGTTTAIVSAVFVYFLLNQLKPKEKRVIPFLLFASAVISSLVSLVATSKALGGLDALPAYLRSENFNTLGGFLPSAMFYASILPLAVGLVQKEKEIITKIFLIVTSIIIIFSLGLSINKMLPGKVDSLRLPNLSTSWSVSVDSLKQSPLLGIGSGNYLTAFSRFRPITYNNTDLWSVKFSVANNFFLTLLSETGMLGAAGFILIIYSVYKLSRKQFRGITKNNLPEITKIISLVFASILLVIFPATGLFIVIFFVIVSLNTDTSETTLNLSTHNSIDGGTASRFPALILTIPILVALSYLLINSYKILSAEKTYFNSITALSQGRAIDAYNLMRDSIAKNPRSARYHASYSGISLALANSIASSANENAETPNQLTEKQGQQITELVQQAIREAKITVNLNPTRSTSWELLAQTYRSVMPLANDAGGFAVQAYNQAIALDPTNPNLRVALGGLFYSAQNYETAIRTFELAVASKRDLANARYNLAFALKENNEIERAISEMTIVLSLVDTNSKDYELAKTALDDFESKVPTAQAEQPTENLTPPQEGQKQIIQPPVELTEDDQPPETPITPTPIEINITPEPTIEP